MNKIIDFFKKHWNRIKRTFKHSLIISTSLLSFLLIFISDELILKKEKCIVKWSWMLELDNAYKPFFYKICFYVCAFLLLTMAFGIYYALRRKIKITGKDFYVEIRYAKLFSFKNCIPVVNSDECFSSNLGDAPNDIKESSVYGQYLINHPNINISTIIHKEKIKPEETRSKFNNQKCYRPGTILNNGDALILAFARLDERGCAEFESLDDYMNCLSYMWEEIRSKHGDKDVAIPILGSGRTKIEGVSLTKQEILDYLLLSYKLSPYKLQRNYKLIICCCKGEISLDNIKYI